MISNFKMLSSREIELIVEKNIIDEFDKGTVLLREGQIPTRVEGISLISNLVFLFYPTLHQD